MWGIPKFALSVVLGVKMSDDSEKFCLRSPLTRNIANGKQTE
jgi:hypothetical protein